MDMGATDNMAAINRPNVLSQAIDMTTSHIGSRCVRRTGETGSILDNSEVVK
jgi:hypothetical protein